jgi:hypothetical protein
MNNKGWVKCYREQFNNWISKKPFCDGYAWTYLYSRANYKKGMINFRNEYIEVKRGQFLTSKLKLKDTFGWTYRHVENLLKALENDEMITYRTTNRYIVITIINYDLYQSNDDESDKQNGEQMINRLGTDDKQITNEATQIRSIKKEKKEKKVKNSGLGNDLLKTKSKKFIDTFNEFKKMREKNKKKMTDYAVKLLIKKLDKMTSDENEQVAIIEQSIENCWQGIFELKDKSNGNKKKYGIV